jgi:hypothetical protein
MSPARGSAAAATALLFVAVFVLLASPGVQGESCMEDCLKECAKKSAEQEDASKKLDASQCKVACSVGCPMYDDKSAAAAGRNGRNVPAHYVCFLIHVAFATLWY